MKCFYSNKDKYISTNMQRKISHENHMKFPHKSCQHVKEGKKYVSINKALTMLRKCGDFPYRAPLWFTLKSVSLPFFFSSLIAVLRAGVYFQFIAIYCNSMPQNRKRFYMIHRFDWNHISQRV